MAIGSMDLELSAGSSTDVLSVAIDQGGHHGDEFLVGESLQLFREVEGVASQAVDPVLAEQFHGRLTDVILLGPHELAPKRSQNLVMVKLFDLRPDVNIGFILDGTEGKLAGVSTPRVLLNVMDVEPQIDGLLVDQDVGRLSFHQGQQVRVESLLEVGAEHLAILPLRSVDLPPHAVEVGQVNHGIRFQVTNVEGHILAELDVVPVELVAVPFHDAPVVVVGVHGGREVGYSAELPVAETNQFWGVLELDSVRAICSAFQIRTDGRFHDHFLVAAHASPRPSVDWLWLAESCGLGDSPEDLQGLPEWGRQIVGADGRARRWLAGHNFDRDFAYRQISIGGDIQSVGDLHGVQPAYEDCKGC